jgi:hypothetical protein
LLKYFNLLEAGHYYCLIYDEDIKKWYKISDTNIEIFEESWIYIQDGIVA